jgi:hypothetical protein
MADEKIAAEDTHIRCKIIIEVLGKPKDHVETTIKTYVENIKKDSGFIVLNSQFSKAEEKNELWAIFVELDIVVKGLPKLTSFCFDYMPSSIEISKPEEFNARKSVIEDLFNDLQAKLHNVDMVVKKQKNENGFLKANLNRALFNLILLSIATGTNNMESLSKVTGIHDEELKMFLDKLVKDNKIQEENGSYKIIKQQK